MKSVVLNRVITHINSGFATGKRDPQGVIQLRMNNVDPSGGLNFSKITRVPATPKQIATTSIQPGDVLFNCTNSPELVGKTCYFKGYDETVVFSNHFFRLQTDSRYLDGNYLARWLTFLRSRGVFTEGCVRWVNQATFRKADLLSLRVPLPPLAKQQQIAETLDAVDALRTKRRESLDQLDALVHSVFLDMFGDPHRSDWPTVKVEDLAASHSGSIRTGPFGSQLLHSEFVESGIRVLGIDNVVDNEFHEGKPRFITREKYEQLRRYTVRPGDILISIMGTCGRCAVVPERIGTAINTKHLCCITLDPARCRPAFMHAYFLKHPIAQGHLIRNSRGAIMSGLNMGVIKRLRVSLPPLSLQRRFEEISASIESQKFRASAHLDESELLFLSLQSRAFNGDL